MVEITIDGREMLSRHAFHRQIAERLHFPDYYGANLDALYDCLTDIGEETRVCLTHADALTAQLGAYGGKIQRVLWDAAAENPCLLVEIFQGDVEKAT